MNGGQEHHDIAIQTSHHDASQLAPPESASPPPASAAAAPEPAAPPPPSAIPTRAVRLPRKSPFVACLLSFLPGVGQIYVGYYKLGFVHNLVFGSTLALMIASEGSFEPLIAVMGIFLAFFFVYNVVDAGRRAVHYNLAVEGGQQLDMPDMNVTLPSFGGSIAGGAALLVVGFLLLLNTRFGLSLDWIEEWWPLAPMALGAYLLIKALQERKARRPSDPGYPPTDADTPIL